MGVAVGALRAEVRPPFIVLAAIAGLGVVIGLTLIFSEIARESAAPPAPPLERSTKAARATPLPRTEIVKIEPAKPNATVGALPNTSTAMVERVEPDAKISALSKKSKAARAAIKKRAAHLKAMRASLPPLPLRNARRPAAEAAKTATAGKPAKAVTLQTGKASWYDFHAQKTASGEKMDRGALTAAHRTLPFGSKVVVENLANGREVEVTINDRGPFGGGRIIDLSRAAAAQIGMIGRGVAKVRLKPAAPITAGAGGAP